MKTRAPSKFVLFTLIMCLVTVLLCSCEMGIFKMAGRQTDTERDGSETVPAGEDTSPVEDPQPTDTGDTEITVDGVVFSRAPDASGYTVVRYEGTASVVSIPAVVGEYPVIRIADHAFESCRGLTSITIPDGVTSIGNHAFSDCGDLEDVTVPDSVTSMGEYAFYKCENIVHYTGPTIMPLISLHLQTVVFTSGTSIRLNTFSGCSTLTSVTIPNSVASIGEAAFSGCTGLTAITLPEGLTSIAKNTFYGCTGLTSLTLPEGLTSIGEAAFYNCRSLTNVTIPSSVVKIEGSAFAWCTGITSFTYQGTMAQWNAIDKPSWWDHNSSHFTVCCTDGDIARS